MQLTAAGSKLTGLLVYTGKLTLQVNKLASRIAVGHLPPAFYSPAVSLGGKDVSKEQKERWNVLDVQFAKNRTKMAQAIAMENLAKSHEEANALIERTTSRAAVGRAKGPICGRPNYWKL